MVRHSESFDSHYKTIHGKLILIGYEPDGDSVRFKADNDNDFNDLYRHFKIKPCAHDRSVQLRFEGADAVELHYRGHRQVGGDDARDKLLEILGFTDIEYAGGGLKVQSCNPTSIPAIILTQAADPFGRPISYILIGQEERFEDNASVSVDNEILDKTVNMQMLKNGYAYPLLYTSTPRSHRDRIREIAKNAKDKKKGIWQQDSSPSFDLIDFSSVDAPTGSVIYPKVYRRTVDYLTDLNRGFTGDLSEWIHSKGSKEDDEVILDERFQSRLSQVIEVHNSRIAMTADIMDMTFVER